MKIITIVRNLTLFMLCLVCISVFGQRTQSHTVYFNDIDGFSGYVKFTTKYIGFAVQLSADNETLVLTQYNTSRENLEALLKAGYDLRGFPESGVVPNENYGYEVLGNAHISGQYSTSTKLHITRNLGERMVTPEFSKSGEEYAHEKVDDDKSYWERFGGFKDERIVTLYIFDLKNEIDRILREYQNEKEAEEKAKQENEAREKEAKSSSSSSGSSGKKEKKADKKDRDKVASEEKTLLDYAIEAEMKGDAAMRSGDYAAALQHYENAENMGRYVDNNKMDKAIDGAMSQGFEELGTTVAPHLSNFFDQATGGFAAIQAMYAPQDIYGRSYTLDINYHGYWKYFCMEMSLGLNYMDSVDFWAYDRWFELDNPTSTQPTKVSDDQIVFRDISNGTIEYKGYQRVNSGLNMLISAGLGFNIPFRSVKPNFMLVGFYNPSFSGLPAFYGYKYLLKVDLWRKLILSVSYNNSYYSKEAFHSSYLTNPYKDRGLNDLEELKENNINNQFTSFEVGLGIKIIDND